MRDVLSELLPEVQTRVSALGFELADLKRGGSSARLILQVRIDRPDSAPGRGVTIDDCATVSRALEQWLDATGQLGERYVLEVSSPGVERPLRWRSHWERFVGREVTVRLRGKGRVRATIIEVPPDQDVVVLRPSGDTQDLTVPLAEARDATLVVDWT